MHIPVFAFLLAALFLHTIQVSAVDATVTNIVEYASKQAATGTVCRSYNFCSVLASGLDETYSLTYLCDGTTSLTPASPPCTSYSLCTAQAWNGNTSYSLIHICRSTSTAVLTAPVPSKTELFGVDCVSGVDVTAVVVTEIVTKIVLPGAQTTLALPTPSECPLITTQRVTTWGTPRFGSSNSSITITSSADPPAFSNKATLLATSNFGAVTFGVLLIAYIGFAA